MRFKKIIFSVTLISIFSSCTHTKNEIKTINLTNTTVTNLQELYRLKEKGLYSDFENSLLKHGFTSIETLDTSIVVDLRYASTNNFLGINLYGDFLKHAFLRTDVAKKIVYAQQVIKSIDSSLTLVIYDALRPQSVQQIMWDSCSFTLPQKKNFLAHPKHTSLHNYGAAVDVSLLKNGVPLDMGTAFDTPGETSYTYIENELLLYGKLTAEQVSNRELLRNAMHFAGFIPNKYEWWHYASCYRKEVDKLYSIVVSFDVIKTNTNQLEGFEQTD